MKRLATPSDIGGSKNLPHGFAEALRSFDGTLRGLPETLSGLFGDIAAMLETITAIDGQDRAGDVVSFAGAEIGGGMPDVLR